MNDDRAAFEAAERLTIVPVSLDEANTFVKQHHRHMHPVDFHKFSLGAAVGDRIVGVAIVGRPVAKARDDGWTLEVLRNCTDGTPNACSFLYGAAWRAARTLGYRRMGTYTLQTESGASLRAAGWRIVREVPAKSWSHPSRPRVDKHLLQARFAWEIAI